MEPMTMTMPVVLTAEEISQLPSSPLGAKVGVSRRVLWHTGTSEAGVMTVEKGHHLGRHTHRRNHHHMWVLDGRAAIGDREVGPGSYVHIPSGVAHDIDASATEGCTVFYLYLPQG